MTDNLIIAGAAPDTPNLGVNALCFSAAANLFEHNKKLEITLLDHGNDYKRNNYPINDENACHQLGAKHSKRFYQGSSFFNIDFLRNIPFINTIQKRTFQQAAALLDLSGGDSFTDLYGEERFRAICYPKKLAIDYKLPLILLPQTYGPFEDSTLKAEAANYVKYASFAFARDIYSYTYMQELLGNSFDPNKHQQAVDVAFLLPTSSKETLQKKKILPEIDTNKEIVGLNVSGLIYNNPDSAKNSYKITINYNTLVKNLVEYILKEEQTEVWLVPHVLAPTGHYESDNDACISLVNSLPENLRTRVKVISGDYDQSDIKGVIQYCSWFCGTRMHATIAGLSNCIPTAGLAYSGKFKGVFASAGQEKSVIDARGTDETNIFNALIDSWNNREQLRKELQEVIPSVKQKASAQMKIIVDFISNRN